MEAFEGEESRRFERYLHVMEMVRQAMSQKGQRSATKFKGCLFLGTVRSFWFNIDEQLVKVRSCIEALSTKPIERNNQKPPPFPQRT